MIDDNTDGGGRCAERCNELKYFAPLPEIRNFGFTHNARTPITVFHVLPPPNTLCCDGGGGRGGGRGASIVVHLSSLLVYSCKIIR